MSYRVTKEHVWVAQLPDLAGALAGKLQALADAGLNLEFIIIRRDKPGTALMFVSPLRTVAEIETAQRAGLVRSEGLHSLRVEGPNVAGLGSRIMQAIATAGLSLRGLSAAALGALSVTNLAFDTEADADKAKRVLEGVLGR